MSDDTRDRVVVPFRGTRYGQDRRPSVDEAYFVRDVLREHCPGFEPAVEIAKMAQDSGLAPDFRLKAATTLMPYCYAQVRAAGESEQPAQMELTFEVTPEEMEF